MNDAVSSLVPPLLVEFLLARMLVASKSAPTNAVLAKAVAPFFRDRLALGDETWTELVAHSLGDLATRGFLIEKPPKPAKPSAKTTSAKSKPAKPKPPVFENRLTEAGRAAALAFLGMASVASKIDWKTITKRYLVAKALGLQPKDADEWKRLGDNDGFIAAVLAKHYQLASPTVPTKSKTLDRLAWRALHAAAERGTHLEVEKEFTRANVLAAAFTPHRQDVSAAELPLLLAVDAVKSKTNGIDGVRITLINNWLETQVQSPTLVGASSTRPAVVAPAPEPREPVALSKFAEAVKRLAASLEVGRFGEHKVFIGPVWDRYHASSDGRAMTRADFDAKLVDANHEGLLSLSRADLVAAMDGAVVAASEIKLPHSSFHFIRTDR